MTVEERIGAADRRKMDGNALFKEEKLEEAMQQYEMVTHLCSLDITLLFYVYTCVCLHSFSSFPFLEFFSVFFCFFFLPLYLFI